MSEYSKQIDELTGRIIRTAGPDLFVTDQGWGSLYQVIRVLQLSQPDRKVYIELGKQSKVALFLKKNPSLFYQISEFAVLIEDTNCATCPGGLRFDHFLDQSGQIGKPPWRSCGFKCKGFVPANLLRISK